PAFAVRARPRVALSYGKIKPATPRPTCHTIASLPPLPAHEINAGLRRRNRERRHDCWSGARPAGTGFATTVRAYRRQDPFSLVRKILRDERTRCSIENLFRGSLPVFSRKEFWRHRSRSGSGRDSQLCFVDG